MAQAGHPLRHDGPAVQTLLDIVTLAFRTRGHNLDDAEWDAWRDEDNKWVAQLKWQAGRTTNKAHWQFLPDGHGGTIAPLDDTAHELIDPDFGRQLRGLAPVRALASATTRPRSRASTSTTEPPPTANSKPRPSRSRWTRRRPPMSSNRASRWPGSPSPHPRLPPVTAVRTSAASRPCRPGKTSCSASAAAVTTDLVVTDSPLGDESPTLTP